MKEIAKLLQTSPEALEAFEKAYQAIDETPQGIFEMNSRQAASLVTGESVKSIVDRIVDELVPQTEILGAEKKAMLPQKMVTLQEIMQIPEEQRPQLSGNLIKKDIKDNQTVLQMLHKSLHGKTEKERRYAYHLFRQGLDIADLDPIIYQILGMNRNTMSHWLPALSLAVEKQDFFKIPQTTVVKVPLPILQLTRLEYSSLTRTTLDIVDQWAQKVFGLNPEKKYFIKTGTYSSKYDFRNCAVTDPKEVMEIGEYLLFIHFQANMMAGPLNSPCIYGVSTTNEWVVREYIEDKENNPCIYHGLPLHTEYRVFVDADIDEVLAIAPYWDPETMKKRFEKGENAQEIHDYIIYLGHERFLMERYEKNKGKVVEHIRKMLPDLCLEGQWSIDVMQNGNDFWIIDMAVAENSAFYDRVPKEKRKPVKENWIPRLS